MNGTPQRSTDRYGSPLVSRRTARALIAIAAAALVAVVALVGYWSVSDPIRFDVVAYHHLADDVIGVEYQVTMDPGMGATCQIQALNANRAQVGFVETTVPAQTTSQSVHQVEISTQGEAVSAEVLRCDPA